MNVSEIGTVLTALVTVLTVSLNLNTWFLKREVSGLRADLKERQEFDVKLAIEFAEHKAMCTERHKNDRKVVV